MTTTGAAIGIINAVKEQYEQFPYPGYPILAKPIWQDGYLTSSRFAALLAAIHQNLRLKQSLDGQNKIAILGCGDMLPYIFNKWESRKSVVEAIDLSRQNLLRAKVRCALGASFGCKFIEADLQQYLRMQESDSLRHCDAYGVLHHLAEPTLAVETLATKLAPGGTARMMIYNSDARAWIHHFQQAFRLMGLHLTRFHDIHTARRLLIDLSRISVGLRSCLQGMQSILTNDARFVDCFLHPRVVSHGIEDWLHLIESSGLVVSALFDRYAELDHLRNPMLVPPAGDVIKDMAGDLRFSNNLEIHLYRPGIPAVAKWDWEFHILKTKRPPRSWFSFLETKMIPRNLRSRIWLAWLNSLKGPNFAALDAFENSLPVEAWQRLSRLGAVFPGQFSSKQMKESLLAPITPVAPIALVTPATVGLKESPCGKSVVSKESAHNKDLRQMGMPREFEITNLVRSLRLDLEERRQRLIVKRFQSALAACCTLYSAENAIESPGSEP